MTRTELNATIDANLPDNSSGSITPAIHRTTEKAIADYVDQQDTALASVVAGVSATATAAADAVAGRLPLINYANGEVATGEVDESNSSRPIYRYTANIAAGSGTLVTLPIPITGTLANFVFYEIEVNYYASGRWYQAKVLYISLTQIAFSGAAPTWDKLTVKYIYSK
jgi:predicted transcriptional regulator